MSKAFQKAEKTIIQSVLGNILMAGLKITGGVLGNSFALIADGIESLTDVLSSFLVWIGIRYANRPADEDHPYGHGKAEPLITFVVVLFLVLAAIGIAYQAIVNIQSPRTAPEAFTLWILAGIIIAKEIMYRIVSKTGKETRSTAISADAWHHRSDAITSLMAFLGVSIALIMGEGWESADDWAALFASGIIVFNAYLIFRPALGEIMDEHIYDDFIEVIKATAEKVDGVISTEKCYVRKHGMQYNIDLHLIVSGKISVQEGHKIAHMTKNALVEKFPEILDVLIHVEPDICEIDF
ncbi:cation diffusion facilitator family transporter [Weeksellaceae bacterium KMM 9713]|uniref:Cation diffusion facilitator family transporter n=1 Tax=Profundicola chukchiensis TaxID=2961959 RepID=A0A9X4N126_9FLAO|nr:cation diffusion facilitator family transporter [Profundicola chukchiensis]MDG4946940.1 cation diffusion facilitator family transporter [Profundicola chukchiensis]